MKKLFVLLFLFLAFAVSSQAANYVASWPSGDYAYGMAVTEQDYGMWQTVHSQKATVTISGPGGYSYGSAGFQTGTVSAIVYVPIAGGWYDIYGVHDIFCALAGAIMNVANSWLHDVYGYSDLCCQQAISTCYVSPVGIVSCKYYPICTWPRCALSTAPTVYGAASSRILFRKKWRITSMGVEDCYGALDIISPTYCNSCAQSPPG